MQIFVNTPLVHDGWNSKTVTLNVEKEDTINNVKTKLFKKTGIPKYHQRLVFCGKTLREETTVLDNNIEIESSINLMLRNLY